MSTHKYHQNGFGLKKTEDDENDGRAILFFDEMRLLHLIFWPSFFILLYYFISYIVSSLTLELIYTNIFIFAEFIKNSFVENKKDIIPLLWGLAIGVLSYFLLYMDSAIPGVEPPSPFSPKTKRDLRRKVHLNYAVPLFTGACIWFIMHLSYKKT